MTLPRLHSSTNSASRRIAGRGRRGNRMLGRDGHEGHAKEGVGARGEDLQATGALPIRR